MRKLIIMGIVASMALFTTTCGPAAPGSPCIPNWYVNLPNEDGVIHVVSMDEDGSMQRAANIAETDGVRQIAQRIKAEVEAFTKRVEERIKGGGTASDLDNWSQVTKVIVAQSVEMYNMKEKKICPMTDGGYQVFVLLSYDILAGKKLAIEQALRDQGIAKVLKERGQDLIDEAEVEIAKVRNMNN